MKQAINLLLKPVRRLDHYLLTHHPNLWRTRLHYLFFICLILSPVLFCFGWSQVEEVALFWSRRSYYKDLVLWMVGPIALLGVIGVIFWRRKLIEFLNKTPTLRQGGLVLLSYFIGLLMIYYTCISFQLGVAARIDREAIHYIVPDTAFLREKQNLQFGDMVLFMDSLFLENPTQHFRTAEEWATRLVTKSKNVSSGYTHLISEGGVRSKHSVYDEYKKHTPVLPKERIDVNKDFTIWPSDSLEYNINTLYSIYAKLNTYAAGLGVREWDGDFGHYITMEDVGSVLSLSVAEEEMFARLSGNLAEILFSVLTQLEIEQAAPWLRQMADQEKKSYFYISSTTLLYKLEFYHILQDFLHSLDSVEQEAYQAYQHIVLQDAADQLAAEQSTISRYEHVSSLRIYEIQRYFLQYPNKKDLAFLDDSSMALYQRMCYFYDQEIPEHHDYLSLGAAINVSQIKTRCDSFFSRTAVLDLNENLYYFQTARQNMSAAFVRQHSPAVYHDIWVKNLYEQYKKRYSENDLQRLDTLYKRLQIDPTETFPAGFTLERRQWINEFQYGLPLDSFAYKKNFLDKELLSQFSEKITDLKETKKELLSVNLFSSHGKGILDIAFIAFVLFFLTINPTRILLNSIITVILCFFGLAFIQQQLDDYFEAIFLFAQIIGFGVVVYLLLVPPYRSRLLSHVLCSFVIYSAIVPLTVIDSGIDNTFLGFDLSTENGVLLSLLMFVILYILYFRHQQLPMKN